MGFGNLVLFKDLRKFTLVHLARLDLNIFFSIVYYNDEASNFFPLRSFSLYCILFANKVLPI